MRLKAAWQKITVLPVNGFFFLQCRRHRHHFQHYLHQSEI